MLKIKTNVDRGERSAICFASRYNKRAEYALLLLCFGAEIDKKTLEYDKSGLLCPINDRLNLLRKGESMGTSLMADEERRFMWNLAFSFIIAHRGAAFKAYYAIRSFITYHGIFMASGYNLGEGSIWRKEVEREF